MSEISNVGSGTISIANSQAEDVTVVIEPWADEHIVAPGKKVDILFDGPVTMELEIEIRPGSIVIYGWPGATMSFAVIP